MHIQEAVETFAYGFAAVRTLHHPYLVRCTDGAFVLEDGPRTSGDVRKTEVIAARPDPFALLELVQAEQSANPDRRLCISAIYPDDETPEAIETFKRLGFRLHSREGFFSLDGSIPPGKFPIQKVATLADIEAFRHASGVRVMTPADLTDARPTFRGFLAREEDRVIGMVRSVHAIDDRTWCSGLWVNPEFRRRGIGASLMAAMIADDRALGYRSNVLSASKLGEPVYEALGYRRHGTLCFLYPPRK